MSRITNTLGILYVNIYLSSDLRDTLGDWLVDQRVSQMISVISEIIHKHGGIISKTIDDIVLGSFPNADTTYKAATEIQLSQNNLTESGVNKIQLELRIALNYGKLYVAAGNISGDVIDIVMQMIKEAKSGEVIATSALVDHLSKSLKASFLHIGKFKLEAINEYADLHKINNEGAKKSQPRVKEVNTKSSVQVNTPPQTTSDNKVEEITKRGERRKNIRQPGSGKILSLIYQDKTYNINENNAKFYIGRRKDNNVIISARFTSRRHASIEFIDGYFILINESPNDTFVLPSEKTEETECKTRIVLEGTGKICTGGSIFTEKEYVIYYSIINK